MITQKSRVALLYCFTHLTNKESFIRRRVSEAKFTEEEIEKLYVEESDAKLQETERDVDIRNVTHVRNFRETHVGIESSNF